MEWLPGTILSLFHIWTNFYFTTTTVLLSSSRWKWGTWATICAWSSTVSGWHGPDMAPDNLVPQPLLCLCTSKSIPQLLSKTHRTIYVEDVVLCLPACGHPVFRSDASYSNWFVSSTSRHFSFLTLAKAMLLSLEDILPIHECHLGF